MFQNKRVAVLGLGRSNRPLIHFLLSHGAVVTGRDRKPRESFGELSEQWEAAGVRLICGEDYLSELDEEILFRSPGIRPDRPEIAAALARGAALTSEMELFLSLCPARVLAITGSDGKTTTTTLTGLILSEACRIRGYGRTYVGGNIGEPLLPYLHEMSADDFAVVELSSFQLQSFRNSPARAAVTNVSPNHLDWHRDMQEYIEAKTNIFQHDGNELLVVNAENEITRAMGREHAGRVAWFSSKKQCCKDFAPLLQAGESAYYFRDRSIWRGDGTCEERIISADELLLPGMHNVENCMTALALTEGLATVESVRAVLSSFTGVRHRLERVRTLDGVTYYNSSIDTSPTRTAAALSALAPKKPIVICGGYDKNIPFEPLAEALAEHAKAVVLTGATKEKILQALQACERAKPLPIYVEGDFTEAVRLCRRIAREGDTVLLSPSCAGFDAFQNFAERGDTFCTIVRAFS